MRRVLVSLPLIVLCCSAPPAADAGRAEPDSVHLPGFSMVGVDAGVPAWMVKGFAWRKLQQIPLVVPVHDDSPPQKLIAPLPLGHGRWVE